MKRPGVVSAAIVVSCILALEVASRFGFISRNVIPAPSEIVSTLFGLLKSGTYNEAIRLTLSNIATAGLIATVLGFMLGVIIHANDFLRRGVEPFLVSYYAVPTFIFYPVLVVIFGVGSAAIISIAVLMSVVAMITATLNGLDRLPPAFTRTARVFQMSPISSAIFVTLPATAPYLFTGMRLVISYSFIGVIASEFILAGEGLGYSIAYTYNNFENSKMFALMLFIILVVGVINSILNRIDRRLMQRLQRGD
jgi:NitT/TauT family transport system permease protein